MAALTPTFRTEKLPVGNLYQRTFRVTIANANAADEWVVTGFKRVIAVVGSATIGTAVTTDQPAYKRNAQGTGQTEDTSAHNGSLAIEGAAGTYEVTVLGQA